MAGTKRKNIIPKAALGRMLSNHGAKRISEEALVTFADVLEDIGKDIADEANKIAKHSGRKTIHAGDIKLAAK